MEKATDHILHQLELERRFLEYKEQLASRTQELIAEQTLRYEASLKELAEARVDIVAAKESLAAKFEIAKVEIAEIAVDRTTKLFSEAKNIVQVAALCAIPILFGAGYMAYSSLKSTATMFVDTKVKEWLSMSTPESPVKITLEKLRTQTVLDSLTARLARQKIDNHFSSYALGISEDELQRLRQILIDPASSESNFIDAARIIENSRGFGASIAYDRDVAKTFETIFLDKRYGDDKRNDLLEFWNSERSILPETEAILRSGESISGDRWMLLAFQNAEKNSDDLADKYAPILLSSKHDENQNEAATYLATRHPLSQDLGRWIDGIRKINDKSYPVITAFVASHSVDYLKENNDAKVVKTVASWIYQAIQSGAVLRVTDFALESDLMWGMKTNNGSRFYQVSIPRQSRGLYG
ncbi:hypothetical protein [Dyella sp.]|uniref:hypothetical protein n=1 Tax=Dyella sp. TaxID=1869338 RepID=UPI002B48AE2C|nr:hypothetical protein [Dyella sp.]HKT29080.1 hypothetical protein [Dyella sp.]